ncbi:MAG: hypothetical protein WC381_09420 [Kiritimatiellia bacterium]
MTTPDCLDKRGGEGSWLTFGQVALLIVIFAFTTTFVKCMHDTFCAKCKKP